MGFYSTFGGLKSFLLSPVIIVVKFGLDPKKWINIFKRMFTDRFQENVILAILFFLLEIETHFSNCQRYQQFMTLSILLQLPLALKQCIGLIVFVTKMHPINISSKYNFYILTVARTCISISYGVKKWIFWLLITWSLWVNI